MNSAGRKSLQAVWLSLLLACVVILAAGCANHTGQPEASGRPQDSDTVTVPTEEQRRFVYLCEDISLLKYQDIAAGIRQQCTDRNVACTIVDGGGNAGILMAYIEELNQDMVDGILVSALTEPLGPLIQSKCATIGVPVFTVSARMRDEEGQDLPGIEISAYESGEEVASDISKAIRRGALDVNRPISVIMCSMSNITSATEFTRGFYDMFSEMNPSLSSDSYVELEVLTAHAEGHYSSLNNFFGKTVSDVQMVFVTFNDDGSAGIVQFVQEAEIAAENLLIGSVGMQANSRMIFEGLPDLAPRYYAVTADYEEMGRQAVDALDDCLRDGTELPHIFMPLGEIVTADKYQPVEAEPNLG